MIERDRLLRSQGRIRRGGITASLIMLVDDRIDCLPVDRFEARAVILAGGSPIIIGFRGKAGLNVGAQMWCSTSAVLLNPSRKANPMVKVIDIGSVMDEPRIVKSQNGLSLMVGAGGVTSIGRVRLEVIFQVTGDSSAPLTWFSTDLMMPNNATN